MTSHKLTKKSYEEFFWIIENELAQVTLVTGTITMTLANIRLIGLTVRVRWLTKILGSITFLTALRVTLPLEDGLGSKPCISFHSNGAIRSILLRLETP